jgi:diphosphomevalonate decarboxylase
MLDEVVTVSSTPNLALVKYWGKRRLGEDCADPSLNLPQNSSVSITVEAGDSLLTRTSVVFSKRLSDDVFYLDGVKQDLSNPELKARFVVLKMLREMAGTDAKVLVVSNNSFPTGAGMASSASGLSALVFASAKALDLNLGSSKVSEITRIGSGSACRSLLGGFVEWSRGKKPDGTDSVARQLFDENYWPEINAVIAVASQEKKKVSSRAGMEQTVETSELYKLRPAVAERHAKAIREAIKGKDFEALADITIRDSMMMHATMLDTKPPIIYLNDVSRNIIYRLEELNVSEGRTVAAYTFDAGPNAFVITLKENVGKVVSTLEKVDGVKRIIKAKLAGGPIVLSNSESLIDPTHLTPKSERRKING